MTVTARLGDPFSCLLFVRTRLAETVIGDADLITTELIGWVSAAILLATIGRQVYSRWRDRSSQGISRWLFGGQITASVGFIIYSWLLRNWVFVATKVLMLGTALFRTVDLPA